ncbi:hypothetical protein ACN27F_31910 [Solwaraspora sp. WMMB335]|uniref:hypothetical protein n=1 Tax=Solwaraspora sp. WMMB335 TaxID=3404118 RepID=UPI003B94747E
MTEATGELPTTGELRVAGSLWSADRARVGEEAARLAAAGLRHVHWDVTDGDFAVTGGFEPALAGALTVSTGVLAEAHLMVRQPLRHVDAWTEFCDVVTVHVEATGWQAAVDRIVRRGRTPAVAVSPGTAMSTVDALPARVGVLVMCVEPGNAGGAFRPRSGERVRDQRGRALLGVDGAVTATRAAELAGAGATWVVSGTDLLRAADPAAWLTTVRTGGG